MSNIVYVASKKTYVVHLTEPVAIESGAVSDVVEHHGHLDIEDGALVFRPRAFEQPTTGYAPGTWLRFYKKEN